MDKFIVLFLFLFLKNSFAGLTYLSWNTVGGNSNRDGFNNNFYDFVVGPNRIFNAPSTLWGMPIFAEGNMFATTRYISLFPIRASIAAFNFFDANPQWTYGENSGVNIIMGMKNGHVYVRDFQQNGSDTIFALNATNGLLVWKSRFTVERGIIWTAAFTDNGDLIVPGSGTKRIMRINYMNGDTVWTNSRIIPNTGAECMCINGNTLYAFEGGITTPKKIIAINLNTGRTEYSSQDLPGDGDQEIPFTVSGSGVVYLIRDGGLMYALKDNGTGFTQLWFHEVTHPIGTYSQIAIGKDSSVYIPSGRKIFRLNHMTGASVDSSVELTTTGTISPRFAIGNSNYIQVGNGASEPSQGKFFIFNSSLQLQREIASAFNYYCGPTPGGEVNSPHILRAGAGTEIKAEFISIQGITNLSENATGYSLSQNYPNPFNPVTNLEFEIPELGFVTLKVYNVLGKEVVTLVNSKLNPGRYRYSFDGSALESGVFYYELRSNDFSETRKMLLTK